MNVAALDEDNTLLAEGTASGATEPRTGTSTAPAQFVIYHDADHSADAVSRYDEAVGLLDAAGESYLVRTVTGTAKVDRLAGVTNSVMPRFFLGDPEAEGWGPSQPKVNNGGLNWLRKQLPPAPEPEAPGITIYHDPNHSAEAVSRYDEAVRLLGAAGRAYVVRTVTGHGRGGPPGGGDELGDAAVLPGRPGGDGLGDPRSPGRTTAGCAGCARCSGRRRRLRRARRSGSRLPIRRCRWRTRG